MTIREAAVFLVRRGIDTKVAAIVALLHVALVGGIVYSILFFGETSWSMYWMLALYIDVPGGVFWAVVRGTQPPREDGSPTPARPQSLSEALHRIPIYAGLPIGLLGIATVVLLVGPIVAPLSPIADRINFGIPLAVFGGVGTFLWADMARRLVRMMLASV